METKYKTRTQDKFLVVRVHGKELESGQEDQLDDGLQLAELEVETDTKIENMGRQWPRSKIYSK